jgi:hypothetical protein
MTRDIINGDVFTAWVENDRRTAGFPNNVERPGLEGKATT